jgi:Leucine-rich repeat (LRR) protein
MKWKYQDLKIWIQNGCDPNIAKNVIKLDISRNLLSEIPKEIGQLINLKTFNCFDSEISDIPTEIGQLINLQYFNCKYNLISKIPKEIGQLINLEYFYCHKNQILEIPKEIGQLINLKKFNCYMNNIPEIPREIGQLINLQIFDCRNNKILEIPKEIGQLINLQEFNCNRNKILEIPKEIGQLINLQEFNCNRNKISEIPREIGKLINLKEFFCNRNKISEIPKEICQLINLRQFCCDDNKISEIPIEITRCIHLGDFTYSNNAIEYIPPQVTRFLKRKKFVQKVYNDTQSVHNHNIQECISNSIIYITQKKPYLTLDSLKIDILNNNILEQTTKELLFEYMEDKTVHSVLNITFEELLISVYDFILNHEQKNSEEIFKILNKEMNDSICKCFTGRISRLINVLNGFDENIKIQISEAEQIGNICILIKQKLEEENRFTDELFKEIVEKELLERNYDKETIKEWLENI